ncbi:E3 ubiquitin-protein ligase PDZRN3-like [Xenia sp. Carnegie-2017]|uniref:E3 ubiquitin-protein ligase PDZRN3-like n=1 Tax=Xenia sp. Carnegie-2017 TaxID=2897299 RepID=UPI001F034FF4|nr:E3 ubiquitin-protein ligase PDZRN3-like [Xenia sp. Carnegie-2017]
MGFPVQRFVGRIDPNLICGICANVLEAAVVTPCGHSFCQKCLEMWLEISETDSCPNCRTTTLLFDLIPVLTLRGIVNNLHTVCVNMENGCKRVMTLENLPAHARECDFAKIKCHACCEEIRKFEVAEHHEVCSELNKSEGKCRPTNSDKLRKTIKSLEADLKKTKKALKFSQNELQKVEKELSELRDEMNARECDPSSYDIDWDPDYNYGYSPQSISSLSRIISKYLLERPVYIDQNRIFTSAKRCYEMYHDFPGYKQDVLILVATCIASNWFKDQQRKCFQSWLRNHYTSK